MQISVIGSPRLQNPVKSSETTPQSQRFRKEFEKLTQPNNNQESQSTTEMSDDATNVLEDLQSFLETGVIDLERLQEGTLDANMEAVLAEYLGITPDQLQAMIEQLFQKLDPTMGEALQGHSNAEKLMTAMDYLVKLSPEKLGDVMNKDIATLVKAAKLVDIIMAAKGEGQTDSADRFKPFSHKLADVIEALKTKAATLTDTKSVMLKQTFKTVVLDPTIRLSAMTSSKEGVTVEAKEVTPVPITLQQWTKQEPLTLTLASNGKSVSAEQLMKQFENILAKSQFTNVNGIQKLSFQLNPGHLGSLRIELSQQDSVLIAKIITTTNAAKETLEGQISSLKQAMQSQNITVERIEITSQQASEQRYLNQDGGGKQQDPREQAKDEQQDEQRIETEYKNSFAEWLLNSGEVQE